jgi:hypothetical protein
MTARPLWAVPESLEELKDCANRAFDERTSSNSV